MNSLKIIYQNHGTYSSKTFLTRTLKTLKTIFQIACYNINNGTIKTPLHVSVGQTIHEISLSKQLIQILNRLGICMSYDEVERQNCSLSLRTIHMSGNENVPLPPSIVPGNLVQAAIDNFDHEEGTPSRIGGSHDTIMVLFQNNQQHQEKTAMQKSDFNINYTQKNNTHFAMSSFE